MFQNKNNNKLPQQPERNVMGQATEMRGEIISQGDFRIDGLLEGNIKTSGKLIVGKTAKVTGDIECDNADVEGNFVGKMKCNGTLNIKSTAVIDGEVQVEKLAIEPGAVFNAICHMKGVKVINKDVKTQELQKNIS